jgi:hypothetical protein
MKATGLLGIGLVVAGAIATGAWSQPPTQVNGWIVYLDSHAGETLPCAPTPILLNGSHTDITLRGQCTYVRVAGEHNDIAIEAAPAATIEITGAHNDVTWRQVAPGPPPRLVNAGTGNTFHHGMD